MTKKHYLVRLLLRIGCYEKHSLQLIDAECQADAEQAALEGESHNFGCGAGFDDGGCWWDDDMIYEIISCRQVPDAEYKVLIEYL